MQYYLFDEAEQLVEVSLSDTELSIPHDETEVNSHKRRDDRKPLPDDLPRIIINHELGESEQRCHCGCEREKIDEVVISEQLDIIPSHITVIEHASYKYSFKHYNEAPKITPMPPQSIPKSQASTGFLVYIATNKYADGLPLHGQLHALMSLGIEQERHTQANQLIKAGKLSQL